MKRAILSILILILVQTIQAQKIKVACIGNSITYGAGIANREKNSYPAQLQVYLGEKFEVKNFGSSGSTLLNKGDYPYIETESYRQSLTFKPDIVIIKLGTNDSKPQNIIHSAQFKSDYLHLIDEYKKLPSKPRIILLTPLRCFLNDAQIAHELIQKDLAPVIQQVAYDEKLEIIDMYRLFGNEYDSTLLPDKIHPSSIGAGVIAKHLYEYLTVPRLPNVNFSIKKDKPFNFYGFQGFEYKIDGNKCMIVQPKQMAEGKPWVLRARFWGHEPQVDIALLERGFHITYCDVSDMYGSDKAVERWNRFYAKMVRAGLNKKVVLEGMSRGGLVIYNWAARNPEKIACIYADAPVLDIKSWPLGSFSNNGSKTDVLQLLKAYSFANEQEVVAWKRNPIDHAKIMAKAKIPILHVVGDADNVVPVSENTAIFESRMAEYGHPIRVIHKKEVGHHPHSLSNPEEIVHFILKSTGHNQNFCIHPVCGNEFRSGAAWEEGADWHVIAEEISQNLQGKQIDLLLLGNSITQGFGGTRQKITYRPGQKVATRIWQGITWESAGISGDRTQHLLWRIQHGNYNICQPQHIVITIGINNLASGKDDTDEVVKGIEAVAFESQEQFPQAHILLFGLLPSGENKNDAIRQQCDEVHNALAKVKWGNISYVNPSKWFVNADGSLKKELYSSDYLHLNENGYQVWSQWIKDNVLKTNTKYKQ